MKLRKLFNFWTLSIQTKLPEILKRGQTVQKFPWKASTERIRKLLKFRKANHAIQPKIPEILGGESN